MALHVDIQAKGLDAAMGRLEALKKQLDTGPGMQTMLEFGREGMRDVDERFATRGYGKWAPLSPITIARKGHNQILIDTSNMRRAVGISEVTDTRVVITVPHGGRSNDKAVPGYHQYGTDKIPQRKIVEVTDRLMDRLRPLWKKWYGKWKDEKVAYVAD